jgi:hypothetical protein
MGKSVLVALIVVVSLGVGYLVGSGQSSTSTVTSTRLVVTKIDPRSEAGELEEEFGIENPCEEFEIPAEACPKKYR